MLIVLDKNPTEAACRVPEKLKFKQLLELGQLICSAYISFVFKPISQGKELQAWVKKNSYWTYFYYEELYEWSVSHINMKEETKKKLCHIMEDLWRYSMDTNMNIGTAIFRYVKEYEDTGYSTNTELPIDVAVEEYERYIQWKSATLQFQK